jgi:L-iditol 2-dehydrogenase
MKVLRLHGVQDLRLHDEPVPQPGDGEVLVRVKAVGVCGSDLHWFAEEGIGDAHLAKPLVLGHEFAGVIADGPRQGERVAVDPCVTCGKCEFCQQGHPNLCISHTFAGHALTDGGLREFVAWPEEFLFSIPDMISDEDGAMLEPLGVAIHTVDLGHLRTGMTVGIFGCGPIGLLAIQLARLSGATQIIVTEKLPHRMEAAQKAGADQVILAEANSKESEAVLAATEGRGVDVAFEIAGENEAVETAVASAKPGGSVILAGIPADDHTSFTASIARRKGLTLRMVRRMKHTYPRAIGLVEKGLVDVRSIVTACYPITQGDQAFRIANERQGLKTVINPT